MAIRTHYDADWGATLKLIDNGDGTYSPLLALSSAQQSSLNTTASPLNDGQTFTGEWEQNSYSDVGVQCKTDQDGTLFFDFSADGVNADSTFPSSGFNVVGGVSDFHTAVKLGRYFRVR